MELESNLIRKGLEANRRLKKTFYHSLYERNLDWAVVLGITFLVLPYIGSPTIYIIIPKVVIGFLLALNLIKYIRDWKNLEEYNEQFERGKKVFPKLYEAEMKRKNEKKPWKEALSDFLNKLTINRENWDYFANLLSDFIEFAKSLDSDLDQARSRWEDFIEKKERLNITFAEFLAMFMVILDIRAIPEAKLKNHKRLVFAFILVIGFFIIHFVEMSPFGPM